MRVILQYPHAGVLRRGWEVSRGARTPRRRRLRSRECARERSAYDVSSQLMMRINEKNGIHGQVGVCVDCGRCFDE